MAVHGNRNSSTSSRKSACLHCFRLILRAADVCTRGLNLIYTTRERFAEIFCSPLPVSPKRCTDNFEPAVNIQQYLNGLCENLCRLALLQVQTAACFSYTDIYRRRFGKADALEIDVDRISLPAGSNSRSVPPSAVLPPDVV